MKLKRSTYTGAFSKANAALQGILGLVGNEASEDLQDLLAHKAPGVPLVPRRRSVSLKKKYLYYSMNLSRR